MFIEHTCIRVQDLEKSKAFYHQAFGFREQKTKDFPDDKFTLCYLMLPGDSYRLELTYNYDHGPYNLGDGYGHIAIIVDDVKLMRQKHVELGYEVTDLSGLPGQEKFYYFVKDPDGYKIEVIDKRSLQSLQ